MEKGACWLLDIKKELDIRKKKLPINLGVSPILWRRAKMLFSYSYQADIVVEYIL